GSAADLTRSTAREHGHLAGGADFGVHVAEWVDANRVAEGRADAVAPRRELGAGPLEAVVRVPELARGQAFKAHVVLAVRRRQHDHAGPSASEQHALERTESRR